MKKRNTTIFAFLLLAAVGMGVGYAALTDNLTVGGNVGAVAADDEWDSQIYFSENAGEITKPDGATATYTRGSDLDSVTIEVGGLDAKGEKVVVPVTIENANKDYAADLVLKTEITTTTAVDTDFTITTDFVDGTDLAKATDAGNGTYTFNVTITLNVQPTKELTASFTMKFDAVSIDPNH